MHYRQTRPAGPSAGAALDFAAASPVAAASCRLVLRSVAVAVAALFGCAPRTGEAPPPPDPCEGELASRCGVECVTGTDCAAGLHCAPEGQCAAECTAGGGQCSQGFTCSPNGTCIEDDAPVFGDGGLRESGRACVHADIGFEELVPTVVILIDKSGSMLDEFDQGISRWESLRRTLIDPSTGLVPQVASRVRLGLTTYTSVDGNQGGACPMLVEVPPALDNEGAIITTYQATEVVGQEDDTPTPDAFRAVAGALAQAREPGAKAIVLATDGEPDTCADSDAHNDATNALSVEAVSDAFADGIVTHVISVGDDVGQQHLEDLARAGAGGPSGLPYRALDAQSLVSAFEQIARGVVTCDFQLSGNVQGGLEASGLVELDGNRLVFGDPNGWELASPSTVRLVGEACDRVKVQGDRLHIEFPCDAYVPIE